jgi:hypothetical protein
MRKELELQVSAKSSLSDILFNIRLAGYGYVCIEYSGSGDSGSIDDVYLIKKENGSQDEEGIITLNVSRWDLDRIYLPSEVRDIIEKAADSVLDDGADWYNNDGGGGTLLICTENGDYYDDRYVNVVEQEYDSSTGNLLK